eukprot:TRINITY_DN5860_c0_g1_i7.p1 TRINITY_DN5860_c0_g1~~TRINITY_DN5860_c0_g1_i7.p1  ORF type:complete len:190 (-),score=32.02 TRINITY_DN5860_c0_g1_i7:42-611(-)
MSMETYMEQLSVREREQLLDLIGLRQSSSNAQLDTKITQETKAEDSYNQLELPLPIHRMRIQKAKQENAALRNRILLQEKLQQELMQKNEHLLNSISNLKNIVNSLMQGVKKKTDDPAAATLQQLEYQSTHSNRHYSLSQPVKDKNAIALKNEIHKLRAELKGKSLEYESLCNKAVSYTHLTLPTNREV